METENCQYYDEHNEYCSLCPYANHVKCIGVEKCLFWRILKSLTNR